MTSQYNFEPLEKVTRTSFYMEQQKYNEKFQRGNLIWLAYSTIFYSVNLRRNHHAVKAWLQISEGDIGLKIQPSS